MNTIEFKHKVFSLSERLFPMVTSILGNNANAEDAIQEIMVKLWDRRKELSQHPNISGYVFLTARNYCLDLLKKKKLEIDDSDTHFMILEPASDHQQLEWEELNNLIVEILKKLPEQQKEILMMRDIDGYEFIEIAAATQLNVEHVRVLLSRARKQVRLELEKIYCYEREEN